MTSAARAVQYAVEALRILRRHPALFLLAVAMGAFGAVDWLVGNYISWGHTAWGRQMIRMVRAMDEEEDGAAAQKVAARNTSTWWLTLPVTLVSPPTPSVSFSGTLTTALALACGGKEESTDSAPATWEGLLSWRSGLVIPVSFLLGFALSTFISAGYLGMARGVVANGEVPWREFALHGRRVFLRFLLLGVFTSFLVIIAAALSSAWPIVALAILIPGVAAILFFLGLAAFVIIADDASLTDAIVRSVTVIQRDVVTALVLIVGPGALAALSSMPSLVLNFLSKSEGASWNPAANALSLLPIQVVSQSMSLAVGAWFSIAAFVWYLDAVKRCADEAKPDQTKPDDFRSAGNRADH